MIKIFPNYIHSYPYSNDPETTTGFSGPIIGKYKQTNEKYNAIQDAIDSRDLVKNSIERIIATGSMERVMRPNSNRLSAILFEPLDEFLLEELKEEITNLVNNYEPRVNVTFVDFSADVENLTINVTLSFTYKNSGKADNFDFAINYLK